MTEIEERRKLAVDKITELYTNLTIFLDDVIGKAGAEAGESFLENLSKHESAERMAQIQELQNEIKKKNNTEGTGYWYVDLAIVIGTGLVGPIAGHLTEQALRKGLGVVFNRLAKEGISAMEQNLVIDKINRRTAAYWELLKFQSYTIDQKVALETIWLGPDTQIRLIPKDSK